MLKKYRQVGRWVASLGSARIASLCLMTIGLSMTVGTMAIIAPSCAWVSSAELAEMAGLPPSLGMVPKSKTEGKREKERKREKVRREVEREREREM